MIPNRLEISHQPSIVCTMYSVSILLPMLPKLYWTYKLDSKSSWRANNWVHPIPKMKSMNQMITLLQNRGSSELTRPLRRIHSSRYQGFLCTASTTRYRRRILISVSFLSSPQLYCNKRPKTHVTIMPVTTTSTASHIFAGLSNSHTQL